MSSAGAQRIGQLLPQATLAKRTRHAKLANALSLKALRQVVENTVGEVVQLVRTLPRPAALSRTIPSSIQQNAPKTGVYIIYIRMLFASAADQGQPTEPKLGKTPFCH